MRFTIFLVLLFCVLFTYGFTGQSIAQRTIGVQWDVPENRETALNQLDTLQDLNITHLEISGQLEDKIWEKIDQNGFRVYGQISIIFPLVPTFADPDSSLLNTISNFVNHYSAQPSVQAVGLFKYGAIHKPAFDSTLQPFIQQIRDRYSKGLYYTTTRAEGSPIDTAFDFKIWEIRVSASQHFSIYDSISVKNKIGGYAYLPDEEINSLLNPFKEFLSETSGHSIPVFVKSDWLFKMLQKNPDFANTLRLYNSDSEFIFPTPKEYKTKTFNHSLIVLLLVIIWGMFAVNYHMSPIYRKSVSRYFLGHVFFVEDVMNRHIRSIGPVMTILIQNILLAGVCLYSLSVALFSPLGIQAIVYHYPVFSILANPFLSFFLTGCAVAVILTLVSIIWIRISNKKIRNLRQVLNLYAWPLQVNFLIATAMVTILLAGNYPLIISLLALLFAGVHISAFIVTAMDTSRYLGRQKMLFLTGSIGIYCLVWIGLGIWIFGSNLPRVMQLALSL